MKPYIVSLLLLSCCSSFLPPSLAIKHNARWLGMHSPGQERPVQPGDSDLVEHLLKQFPQYFAGILQERDSMQVQIIYTQINRDGQNNPQFTNYYFNLHPERYFYPASTVKLPVSVLALQKLHELRLPGLDKNSSMITGASYEGQTMVLNDPSSADGRPTVANYIKRILLTSDNDAYNRLYEFLGQAYVNEQLHKKGYGDAEIRHRLEVSLTEDQNRHTNPVTFFDPAGRLLYDQPMQFNRMVYPHHADSVGRGFYNGQGQLISHPMDFSAKNRIGLKDLQQILQSLLFPSSVPEQQRFDLNQEDYEFLYQYLSEYPQESMYPAYDTASYWDAYCKYLFWGSEKGNLPKNFRIFNKIGDAYGYMIDVAYFADFDRHIEFMLTASLYCNSDGLLNDNQYDYDSVGLPFMKHLGQVIYGYEKERPRDHVPGLLRFRMKYDR
jgi:hypothetical protein